MPGEEISGGCKEDAVSRIPLLFSKLRLTKRKYPEKKGLLKAIVLENQEHWELREGKKAGVKTREDILFPCLNFPKTKTAKALTHVFHFSQRLFLR